MTAAGPPLQSPSTGICLAAGAVAAAALAAGFGGDGATATTLALFGITASMILHGLPAPTPFGWANVATLARAVLACVLAGIAASILISGPAPEGAGLLIAAMAGAALASDAADGWIARVTGSTGAFGARFDMETDAFLILILSVLVWALGIAGIWILAAGLMRYAFVLAGQAWPALASPLPPSLRRKAICVVQSLGLLAMLLVSSDIAPWIGGGTLAALTVSFALDVGWLIGRRATAPAE